MMRDGFRLILRETTTKKDYTYSLKSSSFADNRELGLEAVIDFQNLAAQLVSGDEWECYVEARFQGGRRVVAPLAENKQEVGLFSFYHDRSDKMIVPFFSKKKQLGYKVKDVQVLSSIEKVNLGKNGMLGIEGYAIFPVEDVLSTNSVEKKILLLNKNNEIIHVYNADNIRRNDLTETVKGIGKNYDWAGFSAQLDLSMVDDEQMDGGGAAFHLELMIVYFRNGLLHSEKSAPLLVPESFKIQQRMVKIHGRRNKIAIRQSKNKALTLLVEDYDFIYEMKKKARHAVSKVKRNRWIHRVYKAFFQMAGHLPVKENLIVFESFLGKQYSCNPRAIYEYMKEHCPQFNMVWSADGRFLSNFANRDIVYVKRFSLRWLFLMTRAHYWVVNSRLPLWIPKPKHTVYLQTWHGTPLKRLATDMEEVYMPGTNTENYKANFCKEASKWDYLVSPNAYSTEIFTRAFQFNKQVIESGYPRNDYLYLANNEAEIKRLKKKYGLPLDKKVILYAPTWRDDQFYAKGKYKFDLELDLNLLREKLGNDYCLVMRMHYLVAENLDLSPYEGFAFDFSAHEDIRELYLIADLLITDYSSVFFDYANLRRPMIFFVYDIDSYRDKLRGFYFDFENTAPGPLVKTTAEVIEAIHDIEKTDFKVPPRFEDFYNKFCYLETGQSSEKVVRQVFFHDEQK